MEISAQNPHEVGKEIRQLGNYTANYFTIHSPL